MHLVSQGQSRLLLDTARARMASSNLEDIEIPNHRHEVKAAALVRDNLSTPTFMIPDDIEVLTAEIGMTAANSGSMSTSVEITEMEDQPLLRQRLDVKHKAPSLATARPPRGRLLDIGGGNGRITSIPRVLTDFL